MKHWFRYPEKKPADRSMVLTYNEHTLEYGIRLYDKEQWFNEYGQSTMNFAQEEETISHWTFLPERPDD